MLLKDAVNWQSTYILLYLPKIMLTLSFSLALFKAQCCLGAQAAKQALNEIYIIFFQFSIQVLKWLGGKQELLKEAHLQVNKQSIIKMQYSLYSCMKQTICGCSLCYLPRNVINNFSVSKYKSISLQNLTKNGCGHL